MIEISSLDQYLTTEKTLILLEFTFTKFLNKTKGPSRSYGIWFAPF